MPLPFVIELGVIDPTPPPAAQVTVIPLTGFPPRSVTNTVYAVGSVASIVSVCASPPASAIVLALPWFAVEMNVTGEPDNPPTEAVAVCAPAVNPRVWVAVAMPLPLVTDEAGMLPPPTVTAQFTTTPLTGLLLPSVTSTR